MPNERRRLSSRRKSVRFTLGGGSHRMELTTGEYEDGTLGEIFLDNSKEGTFSHALMTAFAMAISLGLQHGISLEEFQHTFRDFKMEPDFVREIFAELELYYGSAQNADRPRSLRAGDPSAIIGNAFRAHARVSCAVDKEAFPR